MVVVIYSINQFLVEKIPNNFIFPLRIFEKSDKKTDVIFWYHENKENFTRQITKLE